jgi:PBP1b-binding outer membrane lipoprotein LpoB
MRRVLVLTLSVALIALAGCKSGGTKRVDPDVDDKLGGTGLDSADARTIGDWMARSLLEHTAGSVPKGSTVALLEVRNNTRFFIDTEILAQKIQTQLIKGAPGRYEFLARNRIAEVLEERKGKRSGLFEDAGELGKLLGAEYLLGGEIHAISKASRSDRSDYVETFFQLIDAETSRVVWQDSHEFKKVARAGTVYR